MASDVLGSDGTGMKRLLLTVREQNKASYRSKSYYLLSERSMSGIREVKNDTKTDIETENYKSRYGYGF